MKILIVDDEGIIVEALAAIVRASDLAFEAVLEAYDAKTALTLIEDERPQIILTDIRMPGMTGIELVRRLHQEGNPAKVIILSAYREFDYAQQALAHGACDYLVKPISKEKLLDAIRKAIKLINGQREAAQRSSQYYGLRKQAEPMLGQLEEQIRLGLSDKVELTLDALFAWINEACPDDPGIASDIGVQAMDTIGAVLRRAGLDAGEPVHRAPPLQMQTDLKAVAVMAAKRIEGTYKGDHYNVLTKAKRFCRENLASDLTLESVAGCVGMNKSYFASIFKKETGQTFWDFLTGLRVATAKELLETTDLKAYAVGETVGYKNPSHFGRIFKELVGVTPAEYKERVNP